jgi:hypothetical protein
VPEFTRTHRVRPWGGTTEDVGTVARRAIALVSEALGEDPRASVSVKRPERKDEYDTPEAFEQAVGGDDLKSFETIFISVRPGDLYQAAKVTVVVIFYKGSPAAWMTVEGSSEVIVRGVALALQAVLEEGRRTRARWILWGGIAFAWVGTIANVLSIADVGEHGKHGPDELNDVLAIVGLATAVPGLLVLGLWKHGFPAMELRRIGEPTRLQRLFGQPLRWLLGIVLLATITAVIGAIVAKLI